MALCKRYDNVSIILMFGQRFSFCLCSAAGNKAILLTRNLIESANMIEIRPMTIDDTQLGLRLTQQAGWNQIESDWLRFINLEPEGCFVAELDGYPVGTTTTCIFSQVAWIAMVLVDVNARGKGVGTTLLKHAIEFLQRREAVKTIRLDATPAGRRIYEKLEFAPEYELARYEGIARWFGAGPATSNVTAKILLNIIEFDKQTTGTDRGKMLNQLFTEHPENFRVHSFGGKIGGFTSMRPGANAVQIGPCIATMNSGPVLLSDALNRCAGELVFVDIPTENIEAVKIAELSGLKIQRRFMRMCRGERVKDNIRALWASSGPEKG